MDRLVAPGQMLGQRLDDRYRLLRLIGQQDGADVYEAQDERLDRQVAVKLHHDGGTSEVVSYGDAAPAGVLDAGDHDGRRFVVVPLADAAVAGSTGVGDDDPTDEIPTVSDHTTVLPLPLVPAPDLAPAPEEAPAAVRAIAAGFWARRALLAVIAGVVLLVVLLGLAAGGDDGLDVPTGSSLPVSETTTTTIAPTTTSPPTTQPAEEGKGKGKGKKDDDD